MNKERKNRAWRAVLACAASFLLAGCATPGERTPSRPPTAHDALAVPDVRQSTDYSCGAAALQAVLAYYGIDLSEGELMSLLGTDAETGTAPESILRVATGHGLRTSLRENLAPDDLRAALREKVPVIVAFQAWPVEKPCGFSWAKTWEEGHYAVVVGMDPDYIYLEDPALLGTCGRIRLQEFEERWHDYTGAAPLDPGDRVWMHLGILLRPGEKMQLERPPFTDID